LESYTEVMKRAVLLAIFLVTVQLLAGACSSPVTVISTTTVTVASTTTTPQTTAVSSSGSQATTGLRALPDEGMKIRTHNRDTLASYKGTCLICHGAGMPNQYPLPPSWDGKAFGSTWHTAVYSVKPGSDADHTGRTAAGCSEDDCHE
jgi:hypothetical protein